MVLSWFDAGDAVAFGEELARYYDAEFQSIAKANARKQDDRRQKLIAKVLQRARDFGAAQGPNFYQKARLSNRVKWVLKDLGHDDALIDLLVKEVLLAMA